MSKRIKELMPRLAYKLAQRLIVLDVTRLLWRGEVVNKELSIVAHRGFSMRMFSSQDAETFFPEKTGALALPSAACPAYQQHWCCLAEDEFGLAAYVWLALDSIAADDNRGAHPRSGVAMSFPSDTAFVYQAYTRPDARGKGLFPACMETAQLALADQGITRLLSTTDWTNAAALRGFRRAGFQELGLIWRFGLGPAFASGRRQHIE